MVKEKEKIVEPEPGRSSKVRRDEVFPEESSIQATLGNWEQEIEALQGQTFECVDDAITAIVDSAVERMGDTVNIAEVKEFVFAMFDSDPALKDELRDLLSIK